MKSKLGLFTLLSCPIFVYVSNIERYAGIVYGAVRKAVSNPELLCDGQENAVSGIFSGLPGNVMTGFSYLRNHFDESPSSLNVPVVFSSETCL